MTSSVSAGVFSITGASTVKPIPSIARRRTRTV
jgi:hypothetical protein